MQKDEATTQPEQDRKQYQAPEKPGRVSGIRRLNFFSRKFVFLAGIGLAGFLALWGQSPTPAAQPSYTTWSHYGGSVDSMQYSALDQVNKSNVSQLKQVWFYPVPGPSERFGFSPLIVGGTMYVLGKDNAIVALDAGTGKEIWSHPVEGTPTSRGINYWQSKDGSDRRLLFGARGNLQAIDARTGKTILSFGDNGMVNMREGDFRPLGGPSGTPGRVFENLDHSRFRHGRRLQRHPGRPARFRCAHRKTSLDLPYHPSPRRVRL